MENFCLMELRFNVCESAHVNTYTGKEFIDYRAGVHASCGS